MSKNKVETDNENISRLLSVLVINIITLAVYLYALLFIGTAIVTFDADGCALSPLLAIICGGAAKLSDIYKKRNNHNFSEEE